MPPDDPDFPDQALRFNDAMWDSIGKGAAGTMTGLWSIAQAPFKVIQAGVNVATDPVARENAWNSAVDAVDTAKRIGSGAAQYGEDVLNDPTKPLRDVQRGAYALKDAYDTARDKAAAAGRLPEFYGGGTGTVLFNGVLLASGVGEAEAVGEAGQMVDAGKFLDNPVVEAPDALASSVRDCPIFHTVKGAGEGESVLGGIDPAYLNPDSRFGKAFYLSDDPETTVAELQSHGFAATHTIRYELNDATANVLDLTDPSTAQQWGYNGGAITDATKAIGENAASSGYNALKFPSERGSGTNYAILKDFDSVLTPQMIFPSK